MGPVGRQPLQTGKPLMTRTWTREVGVVDVRGLKGAVNGSAHVERRGQTAKSTSKSLPS